MLSRFHTLPLFLLVSACTLGPDYKRPDFSLPDLWAAITGDANEKLAPVTEQQQPAVEWWKQFSDATLDTLIEQAVANNRDLKIATARVVEARGIRDTTVSGLFPNVDGKADASRGQSGFFDKPANVYNATFDASWELDLFGATRRRTEATEADIAAMEAAERGALISLRAEVARAYIEMRNIQNQLRITSDSVRAQKETYSLTKAQLDAGLVSQLDTAQAESLYLTTEARMPQLETQLVSTRNQLAVLLGIRPDELPPILKESAPVPVASAKAVIASPAQVMAARPDIAQAERELARNTALQGAALADFFPKFSLSGFFGLTDADVGFMTGRQTVWSAGGNVVAPLFNFKRLSGQLDATDARQVQALNKYEQTILQALAEVENNLVAYVNEDRRRATLTEAERANGQTVSLSSDRYKQGVSAFLDVLSAQRELYLVQSQRAESQAQVSKNLVALYKSLGQ